MLSSVVISLKLETEEERNRKEEREVEKNHWRIYLKPINGLRYLFYQDMLIIKIKTDVLKFLAEIINMRIDKTLSTFENTFRKFTKYSFTQ